MNSTINKALFFVISIFLVAVTLAVLNLDFYLVYLPPILVAFFTIVLFVNNINIIREKSKFIINNILFGFLIAWLTLFFSAITGSLSLLYVATLEFLYPTVFPFGLTSFEAYSNEFSTFFFKDGLKYFLAPLIWGLLIGFIPALLFGVIYGLKHHDHH